MSPVDAALDLLCINTIRTLSLDAIQKAASGHPGLPLGAAPMAYVLWTRLLRHNPQNPNWPDRDRFVLSAGHGSMLLYTLLFLSGYDLSLEDLKNFRQWDSKTPGHPEKGRTKGVEVTTGPLGQGAANAVGMAVAERQLAQRFNRPGYEVVDHHIYALISDGDLMEGVCAEAASLAGHLKLGKLIFLYDANGVTLDGPCSLSFTEDVSQRFLAYGWHVQMVPEGDTDLLGIAAALNNAKEERTRPSLVIVKTTIGYGSPHKAGTSAAHGSPLGEEEVAATKKALGWQPDRSFHIPDPVREHFSTCLRQGRLLEEEWGKRFEGYAKNYPAQAQEFREALSGELKQGWDRDLPEFETGSRVATRVAGGRILNALARNLPSLIGGDADLGCSTKTTILEGGDFEGVEGRGLNIHFGVREHAMGAMANGMAHHGGVRPFVATFFCFSDYMRPALRLAALDRLAVIHVWTHDSIGVGEDGPTHQPVEQLAGLRAMPGFTLLRPGDANETLSAWKLALAHRQGPLALVLSRQALPVLPETRQLSRQGLPRGAYILVRATGGRPRLILISSGSELHLAYQARLLLEAQGIPTRLVSMPSFELFSEAPSAYREDVLPSGVTARLSIEAAATFGWDRFVGPQGRALGLDRFGASAPGPVNFQHFGFTAEAIAKGARELLP